MEATPLLSICLPTGAGLTASLKIALAGAFHEVAGCPPGAVEVLVSDNGGPEATRDLLAAFRRTHPDLRCTGFPEARARGDNYRHCLEQARGEFVWVLGDHDLFLPGAVAQALAAIGAGADAVLCGALQANPDMTRFLPRHWFKQPYLDDAWSVDGREAMAACLARLDYQAGALWPAAMAILRRRRLLAALPPELPADRPEDPGHLAGLVRSLDQPTRLHWIARALVMRREPKDHPDEPDPWIRLARDQEAWAWIAGVCFPDRADLRDAWLEVFRAGTLRSHCVADGDEPGRWAAARTRLAAAGFMPVRTAAMNFAHDLLLDRVPPPRSLERRDACLADLALVARGARRIAVLAEAGPEAPAVRAWLGALGQATRADLIRVVGPPGLMPPLPGFEWQPLDRARFLAEEPYREAQLADLRAFAPHLLVNLCRERGRLGEMLAAAAGAEGALGFGRPCRPDPAAAVPSHTTRLLRSRTYHRLVPAGAPLGALTEALGLAGSPAFLALAGAGKDRPAAPGPLSLTAGSPPPARELTVTQKRNPGCGSERPAGRVNPEPSRLGPAVRWEGSQFVYHSLAHVNRQLCLGLARSGRVDLSLVPYEPDQFAGAAVPAFQPLAAALSRALPGPAAVHVRHQWPPSFQPPAEGAWVMIQPWEFGGIPAEWVAPMRDLVDEVWVPSSWLKDCYVQSGIPAGQVVVVPNGVDGAVFTPDGERFPLATKAACKFLFVGGTIHRKGIDLLLDAYLRTFRRGDDVCLVIKEQGQGVYAGQGLGLALAELRRDDPEAPDIEYLAGDLTEERIAALYRSCDVLVLPYRGEGFGLPIAEAMASGLPVLVTGRGAARDFTREDWAYLIPSRPVEVAGPEGFTASQPGFWLEEPDAGVLAALMRRACQDPEERRAMGRKARAYALAELGWDKPVALALERIQQLAAGTPRRLAPAPAAAPVVPPEPAREAFLYRPDWAQAEWAEVLLSFLLAFKPGEPVALVLPWTGAPGEPALEAIQNQVLGFAKGAGIEVFPDIVLVDQPGELQEVLAGYAAVTEVPRGRGAVAGLTGAQALRLAAARARLCRG